MITSILFQASLLLTTYEVVETSITNPAPHIEREVLTISYGPLPFERFNVVHISAPWTRGNPNVPSAMFIAPLGQPARWWEATDEYADSLPVSEVYLGVDTWIVEQRMGTEETLPIGSCPGPNCEVFGEWSFADVIEDIEYVRTELIDAKNNPTIVGHWTGAMTAAAVINEKPENYSGVVLWEGTLLTDEPFTLAKNSQACAGLGGVPDAFAASTQPWAEVLAVKAGDNDPFGFSPVLQFFLDGYFLVSGVATNLDYLHALFIVDNPALLDRVSEGLVFMVGTVSGGPDVADIGQIINVVNDGVNVSHASLGILTDMACGLGGNTDYTDNLAAFTGDVIVIGSDRGMRDELQDTLDAFTNARFKTAEFRGEFGVYDLFFSDLRMDFDVEIATFSHIAQF